MRQQVGRLKVKIRRVLDKYNVDPRDLFTAEGWAYLDGVSKMLLAADQFVLKQFRQRTSQAEKQLKQAQRRLRQSATKAPAREQEARAILRSAPRVGEVLSEVVLAEKTAT